MTTEYLLDQVTSAFDSDYDINIDDFDGVDYIGDALGEGVSLDDFFRSFSFHRINGDDYEYGGSCCDQDT